MLGTIIKGQVVASSCALFLTCRERERFKKHIGSNWLMPQLRPLLTIIGVGTGILAIYTEAQVYVK
jgi:hypothetical protein